MATKMSQGASEATDIAGKVSALQASAKQAVESGNISADISSFEQLRATAPDHADILSNLGKLYYMSGNLDAAIEFFGDSAAAAPENEAFKANHIAALGMSAGQNVAEGNLPAAFALLRTALAHDPGELRLRGRSRQRARIFRYSGRTRRFHTKRRAGTVRHAFTDYLHAQDRFDLSQGNALQTHGLAGHAPFLCLSPE